MAYKKNDTKYGGLLGFFTNTSKSGKWEDQKGSTRVSTSYSRKGSDRTDFLIQGKHKGEKGHFHISVNDRGGKTRDHGFKPDRKK